MLVDRVGRTEADDIVASFVFSGENHQLATVNLDFLRLAKGDPAFRAILNASDLVVADGMPIVWLSRLLGAPISERVTGFDLIESSCRHAIRAGIPVFFAGATPAAAEAAARELQRRHAGLRIAGMYSPPFGGDVDAEDARMAAAIRAAGRCVLFVAFGAPRQDRFIRRYIRELDIPVAIGVGGAFDVLSGAIQRAPRWVQRAGLEWAWRLLMEPRRLWRRYLVHDIPFVGALVASIVRSRVVAGGAQ